MYSDNISSPLKRRRDLYLPILLTLADLACVVAGLIGAYGIRFHTPLANRLTPGHSPSDYRMLFPLAVVAWMLAFCFVHLYRRNERIWSWRVAGRIAKGVLLAAALFVTALFFIRPETDNPFARSLVPLSMGAVFAAVTTQRWLLYRRLVLPALRQGKGLAKALLLGVGPNAKDVARSIRSHPEYGWRIVGFLAEEPEDVGRLLTGIEVKGTVEDLPRILDEEHIEAVFVAKHDFRRERLGDVFIECQKRMVNVKLIPDLTEMLFSTIEVEEVDGIPFLGVRETPLRGWNVVLKRVFDVAVSLAFLVLLAPVMAVIAWLVKRDSPGPILFRQRRVGADGRDFLIRKFRTMYVDAEKRTGPVFALPDDPRQTRVGALLRQLHLDELPQLFNVLLGDMSLVGPRPERPHFVERFREEIPRYMARHGIKSGMTGWAQVSGQTGHEGTIAERLRYDLYYIENWSFFFDLKVLFLTAHWMLRRKRQMFTLPPGHPSLRRSGPPDPDGLEPTALDEPSPNAPSDETG